VPKSSLHLQKINVNIIVVMIKMYQLIRKQAVLFFLFLLIISCGKKEQQQTPPPEIQVVEVIQKDVPIYREFVGQVYGEKDIPIRARVEGFLEGIHFNEGLKVTRGQLLYSIDPLPFESRVNAQRSNLAEAQTMLVKAESDLNRYKPLAKKNAVSQSDLDAAQAQYDASLSAVEAAKANLKSAEIELGYCKIYSPIEGIIGKTLAREGDFVGREPNPVILNTVSKTDNVRVTFFLTESEYLTLTRSFSEDMKKDYEGNLDKRDKAKLELILSDGSTYEHTGEFDFIDRSIDASTGSILIQASFPNPNFILRPGMYGKVRINMKTVKGGILAPQRCLMELQGQYSAFVVKDDNTVEARQVNTGPPIGDYVLITEGLSAGEKLVIDGIQKVRTGLLINPIPSEFVSKTEQQ
jgi:membrane fusion protein (multidrug efflux system)